MPIQKKERYFIKKSIPESLRGQVSPHEGNHLMRQAHYQPYLDFLLRTPEMLNTGAEAYGVLLDAVSKHRGIGIDELDIEDIDFDKKFEIFYDEVNAIAYGAIASGHIPNDLPKAFKNYSAYAAELRKIHDSYTTGMHEHLPLFNESDETQ